MESLNQLSREEQVEKYYENISDKVDFILDLHELLLEKDAQKLSYEELKKVLYEKFNSICEKLGIDKSIPSQIDAKIDEREKLKIALKHEVLTESEILFLDKNQNDRSDEILEIKKNDDNYFVYSADMQIRHILELKKKYEELELLYKKGDVFYKKINDIIDKKEDTEIDYSDYIKEIKFNGLSVEITLSKKIKKILPKTRKLDGWTNPNSPVFFVMDPGSIGTREHELNHVLYGGLESHQTFYGRELIEWINKHALRSNKYSENDMESFLTDMQKFIENHSKEIFGELMADLSSIFDSDISFATGYYNHIYSSFLQLKNIKIDDNVKNKEKIQKIIDKSIDHLEKESYRKFTQLALIVFLSKKYSLEKEAKSSVILFKDNFKKTIRYIKEKIGDSKYDKSVDEFSKKDPKEIILLRESEIEKLIIEKIRKEAMDKLAEKAGDVGEKKNKKNTLAEIYEKIKENIKKVREFLD